MKYLCYITNIITFAVVIISALASAIMEPWHGALLVCISVALFLVSICHTLSVRYEKSFGLHIPEYTYIIIFGTVSTISSFILLKSIVCGAKADPYVCLMISVSSLLLTIVAFIALFRKEE